MKLIWTKSSLPLSLIIRLVTGEDCSHFAFVFESPEKKGLMFESNLLGTHPKFFKNAQKSFTIVHETNFDLSIELEDKLWDIVIDKYDDKPYDIGGAIYLGWRILLYRIFGITKPAINKWGSSGSYFCDEVYDALEQIGLPNVGMKNGMDTPHDLWIKLSNWRMKNA